MVVRLDPKALQDSRSQTSVLRSTRSTFDCIVPAEAPTVERGLWTRFQD
jgi:hypothetical protein